MLRRRDFLRSAGALAAAWALPRNLWSEERKKTRTVLKTIPSTGETLPAVGMGTWQTFDVGRSRRGRARCVDILRTFFQEGGGMIDSSPMYGSSEEVIGHCFKELGEPEGMFSATKVWTPMAIRGHKQIDRSFSLWGVKRMDLYQVHNLVDWEEHLETLRELKRQGKVRYVGVTTSHGRRHEELEKILKTQTLDFVQLTYNIHYREAEDRLLPLARDRGVAVIANRPYDGGRLPEDLEGKTVPAWAVEAGMRNWPEFLLKFILSHDALTCAIPATSRPEHMLENMAAARGALPSPKLRRRMLRHFETL